MSNTLHTEVSYLFDIYDSYRAVFVLIKLSCKGGVPPAPLSINHDSVTQGLRDAEISIEGEKIDKYQLINGKKIEVNLGSIDKKNSKLKLGKKLKSGGDILIEIKYTETIDLKEEGNWAHVLLGFGSDLQSTNTTLYFCLPKMSTLRRLVNYCDPSKKNPYEVIGFPHTDTTIYQNKLKEIGKKRNLPKKFLSAHQDKKRNVVAYFTVAEENIEQLQFFSYLKPEFSIKKVIRNCIVFIITLIAGGFIDQLLFSGPS